MYMSPVARDPGGGERSQGSEARCPATDITSLVSRAEMRDKSQRLIMLLYGPRKPNGETTSFVNLAQMNKNGMVGKE